MSSLTLTNRDAMSDARHKQVLEVQALDIRVCSSAVQHAHPTHQHTPSVEGGQGMSLIGREAASDVVNPRQASSCCLHADALHSLIPPVATLASGWLAWALAADAAAAADLVAARRALAAMSPACAI